MGAFDDLLPGNQGLTGETRYYQAAAPGTQQLPQFVPPAGQQAAGQEAPAGGSFADLVPAPQYESAYEAVTSDPLGAARSWLGQGLGLGFGDEAVALARSYAEDRPYEEVLEEERGAVAEFRRRAPLTALAGELVSGFALPGIGAARVAARAPSLGQAVRAGMTGGAAYGGAAGVGASEGGPAQRLSGGLYGAALGGGLGAALPLGAAAARNIGGHAKGAAGIMQRQMSGEGSLRRTARQYLGEKLRQSGRTTDDIQRALDEQAAARQLVPGEAPIARTTSIIDVDEDMLGVARGLQAANVGGVRQPLREALEGRQFAGVDFTGKAGPRGQMGRIEQATRQMLDIEGGSLADDLSRMTDRQQLLSRIEFDAARGQSQPFNPDPVLKSYRNNLRLRDEGQRATVERGFRLFEPNPAINQGPVRSVDAFEDARYNLETLIQSLGPRDRDARRVLQKFNNDMRDVAAGVKPGSGQWRTNPKINKGYFKALDNYGERARLIELAEEGTKAAREGRRLPEDVLKGKSFAERNILKKAWHEEFMGRLNRKQQGTQTGATGELMRPETQKELAILSPRSDEAKRRLGTLVKGEEVQTKAAQQVLSGSPTSRIAADIADTQGGLAAARQAAQAPGLFGAAQAAVNMLRTQANLTGRQARYLAGELTNMNPQQQRQFLDAIRKDMDAAKFSRFADAIGNAMNTVSPAIAQGLSAYMGRIMNEPRR